MPTPEELETEVAWSRQKLQDEVKQSEQQAEYLRRVIASSPDCIKTLDLDGNLLTMNEGGQAVLEIGNFTDLCGVNWSTFWQDDIKRALLTALDAARAGGVGRFQGFCPTFQGTPKWWDVVVSPLQGADGKPEKLMAVSRDITALKQAEARETARLTDIVMQAPAFIATLRGPQHVFDMANPPYCQLVGNRDLIGKTVAEALPEVIGQGFSQLLDSVYQTGVPFVGKDVSVFLQVEPDNLLEEHFVDFTYQPLRDADGAVCGILVHGVDLTPRKRLEQEREQLLAETRVQAAREALLNQIGAAARTEQEPEAILQAAVSLLGQELEVDRCYFVDYDFAQNTARVFPEWFRDGLALEPFAGRTFQPSAFSINHTSGLRAGEPHVVEDVMTCDAPDRDTVLALGIRSMLRVPLKAGEHLTSLTLLMAHTPRSWTPDEVSLVKNAAALLESVLEAAESLRRERNIAQQLQAALQPELPANPPSLALASYYRPALDEANIGGISSTCIR